MWYWKSLFNGDISSLENKSSRPKRKHPNAHTEGEINNIKEILRIEPTLTYMEIYGKLRSDYSYKRSYSGMRKCIIKNHILEIKCEQRIKYIPKKYYTPEMLGIKWQMDVKYVPKNCYHGENSFKKYYQYTIIDEATRERFIFPYKSKNALSTIDFVKRAIIYFGYTPYIIQTDNGAEFTAPRWDDPENKHPLDVLLSNLKITHKLIRPGTPRHNGKVERSHRIDAECFYKRLQFKDYNDLKLKMQSWLVRYNNRPHSALLNPINKHRWLTPLECRTLLINTLNHSNNSYNIRFISQY